MKLRIRVWLPAAATALVTLVIAALLTAAERRRDALDRSVTVGQEQIDTVARARLLVDGNVTRALAAVYSSGMELTARLQPEAQRSASELERLMPRIEALQSPLAKPLVAALAQVTGQVAAANRLKQEGDVGGARELVDDPLTRTVAEFGSTAAKVLEATESAQREARALAERSRQSQLAFLALAVLFLLGVTVASAALLARSVCGTIEQVQAFARGVAEGDLRYSPGTPSDDEVGYAVSALDAMRLSLAATVQRVLDAAAAVLQASEQINASSRDLSHRTETSAASLQSLRGMAAQSRGQAVGATVAGENLLRDCDAAHHSNEAAAQAVREMILIMRRIDQNARSVAESIQKVESIAFQTGILALNASIEAAHAGHSGRGFAVVAENVQVLARSSSSAAKDMYALIEANLGSTEVGQRRVAESSSAMDRIARAFEALATQLKELASAVHAQRESVEQMSSEIERVEQSVAQNAALSEQSAAAAGHLRTLAHAMAQAVAHTQVIARA